MRCKLITLFLFFEVAYAGTAKRVDHNETPSAQTAFREDQTDVAAFNLLNPKQIERAEVTIRHFLTKLVGPIAQPITLRSSDGNNLQMTINTICTIIRDKIIQFIQACGLNILPSHEQMPWNSTTSEDWFTESLVQGSLLLRDLTRVGEEAWFTIDSYFNTHNISLRGNNDISTRKIRKSQKFLGVINDASRFNENLFKCLRSMSNEKKKRSSFDLNQALMSLAADSPHSSMTSFKSRLDRAFSRSASSNGTSNKQLYPLLCQSLIEKANQYNDCIEELRCLVTCVSSSVQDSNAVTHRTFPVKPWLAAIEDLSDCRIYVDANSDVNIRCDFERKLPNSTLLQVKYIYEKILGRQIPRQSSLHYIVNELGSVLTRSTWTRQFVYDVCQYLAIYQDGRAKLRVLSKIAARDQKAAARQRKISKSLNLYKDGALKKTMLAISNFHRSVLETQKFFVYGMNKMGIIWRTIQVMNILLNISLVLYYILKSSGCKESDDTDIDVPIITTIPPTTTDLIDAMTDDNLITTTYKNNKINQIVIYSKKNQMRKERSFDEAFEKLLQSMNHVSNIHRNRNGESILACLANNLLLTAMFMEAISLVSTLFCLGQKNESTSEEIKKDWFLSERNRRTLLLTNFTDIYTNKQDFSNDI